MKNLTILFVFLFISQQNLMAQVPKYAEPQTHAYQIYKQSIKNGASDRDRYIWVQDSIWYNNQSLFKIWESESYGKGYSENDDLGRPILSKGYIISIDTLNGNDTSTSQSTYTYLGDFRSQLTEHYEHYTNGILKNASSSVNKIDVNDQVTEVINTPTVSILSQTKYKGVLTYLSYGKSLTKKGYSWINDSWRLIGEENNTYNQRGNWTSRTIFYRRNETETIESGSKLEWIYDDDNRLVFVNNYEYDTLSTTFNLIQKDTLYYQGNSNKIEYEQGAYLNKSLNQWLPDGKLTFTYDNNDVINNAFYYDTDSKLLQQDSFYTGQPIFGKTDYKSYQFQFWHNANSDTTVLINLDERVYDSLPGGRACFKQTNYNYNVFGGFNYKIKDEWVSWYHIITIPFPSPENTNSSPICMMSNPYILGSNIYCESKGAKLMRVYDLYGREIAKQSMESGITSLFLPSTTPDGFYVICTYDATGKQLGRQKFVVTW
jgi:hypothetical protein